MTARNIAAPVAPKAVESVPAGGYARPPAGAPKKFMRITEAARYCELDHRVFRAFVKAGKVPYEESPVTSSRWFSRAALDKFMAEFGYSK